VVAATGVHLVDTVEVAPEDVGDYLELVGGLGVTVMSEAGATLAWCATTPAGMGEDVAVQVAWRVHGFERWNEIRRNLVLDPRWYRFAQAAARLRRGGTRRFFTPVALGAERSEPPPPA